MADWLQIKKERGKKKQGWLLAIDCLINQSQNEKGRGKDAVEWPTELHNKKERDKKKQSIVDRSQNEKDRGCRRAVQAVRAVLLVLMPGLRVQYVTFLFLLRREAIDRRLVAK